jgi:hypothetical protein
MTSKFYAAAMSREANARDSRRPAPIPSASTTMLIVLVLTCANLGTVLAQDSTTSNAAPAPVVGPRIEFATTNYDFGMVTAGVLITYDFVFTNTGDRMLEISNVIPACCLTLEKWDREVPRGQTGKISVRFDSSAYSGPFRKSLALACNATEHPFPRLVFRGEIWKPIEVMPAYAVLTPLAEAQTNETKTLRIINHADEPLTLSTPECSHPSLQAELKTVKEGKEFELLVSPAPPLGQTNVTAVITLRTSWPQPPTLRVSVLLLPKPVVEVLPKQLLLVPSVSNLVTLGVTIRNNDTRSLVLSDPTVDLPGVKVEVGETGQGGRTYRLTLTFPPGFSLKPGQRGEVSVKSNHPKSPLIRVPILQAPPPSTKPPAEAKRASAREVITPRRSWNWTVPLLGWPSG